MHPPVPLGAPYHGSVNTPAPVRGKQGWCHFAVPLLLCGIAVLVDEEGGTDAYIVGIAEFLGKKLT
ncbi:MAG TPA: hypothetical protein VKK81_26265 [Candidatus Binatia bacterium]|nr:hypothetical protein [Candidatus Binatia bacterium]